MFHGWSNAIVSTVPSTWGLLKAIPSLIAFLHYIRRLVQTRRVACAGRPGRAPWWRATNPVIG